MNTKEGAGCGIVVDKLPLPVTSVNKNRKWWSSKKFD